MIWLALCIAMYTVMGLCLLALCRAASFADRYRDRRALDRPSLVRAR
ncbi:MAG TPA: hypothetical protein VIK54_07660 [Acidimicrobiia bacterium]